MAPWNLPRVSLVVAVAALVLALPSALAQPAQSFSYRVYLERLPGTTLGYMLENLGTTPIKLMALRGDDFTISGANVLTAGGGSAACGVAGDPSTLTCRNFELRKGRIFAAVLATTRPATRGRQAITDGTEPREGQFFQLDVKQPAPRATARAQRRPNMRVLIGGQNVGFVPFRRIRLVTTSGKVVSRVLSFRVFRRRQLFAAPGEGCTTKQHEAAGSSTTRDDFWSEIICGVRGNLRFEDEFLMNLLVAFRGNMHVDVAYGPGTLNITIR